MKNSILIFSLLAAQLSHAEIKEIESLTWKLEKSKEGIQISTAKVPGSPHLAYLAVTVIDAEAYKLAEIIRNPSTCVKWVHRCEESYRYDQESTNIDLVYTASNMPFPVRDRDTLTRITWDVDPETKVVRATGKATKNIMEESEAHLRIEDATVIFELTPMADSKTQVRSYVHVDPKFKVPAWVSNKLALNIPIQTLKRLKKMATGRSK